MPRSSARRGQVEPLAALVAVAVLLWALGGYAGALRFATPDPSARDHAGPPLERATEALRDGSVVDPNRLSVAADAAPDGYRLNVTILSGDERWSIGPAPPENASAASRTLPVRVTADRVDPGAVRVEVWR